MTRTQQNRGIHAMIGATLIFAAQDLLSRHLAAEYNTFMIVMIRYWFFAAFVIFVTARQPQGIRQALRPHHPVFQIIRGLILVLQIVIMTQSFVTLGLITTTSVFICHPLIVAALSGPVLGEHVGWRRWLAIFVGFLGVMLILRPGTEVFSPLAILPLVCAGFFATYSLMTRYVSRKDRSFVSLFWTGVGGCAGITVVGLGHWQPLAPTDAGLMAVLCVTTVTGHWLLIRSYDLAEASAVQPFAYLQLVWISLLAITIVGETLNLHTALGAGLVTGAGLFTLWRERYRKALQ